MCGEDYISIPYCLLHFSKKGKRRLAQSCSAGESPAGTANLAAAPDFREFFISIMFPRRKEGGGPLMPCLVIMARSLRGLATNALYKRTNKPITPSKARDMNIFEYSNWPMISENAMINQ